MNPKKFDGMANHSQEPWKLPLPEHIEYCYEQRFGKRLPEDGRSLEKRLAEKSARKRKDTWDNFRDDFGGLDSGNVSSQHSTGRCARRYR